MLFAHLWLKLGPAHTRGRSARRFLATGRRAIDGHPGRRRFAAVLPGMKTADRSQIFHSAGSGGRNVCPLLRHSCAAGNCGSWRSAVPPRIATRGRSRARCAWRRCPAIPDPRSSAGSHPRLGADGKPRDEPVRAHRLRAMAARGAESRTQTSNLIHRP